MGSLERRIAELEEQFSHATPGEEEADPERAYLEATGEPRPPIFGRYEEAVGVFRSALGEAKAANPGVSRVPETPELAAAHGEMLRARGELRAFSRERGKAIGREGKGSDS